MLTLSQIWIYPIKSLAGIALTQSKVDRNGLEFDRQWMLIDAAGQFLSQRRLPKMALIKPEIVEDRLRLHAPDQPCIDFALYPSDGDDVEVDIWHDHCLAKTVNPRIDQWFSNFLDQPCRLVYLPKQRVRQVDQQYAQPSDQTAFSDGFPFLIASEASLADFNRASGLSLTMPHFRPNLVLTGCEPYGEDSWRQIAINGIGFRLPKPCSRCVVPSINPETAESDKSVLAALSRLRAWNNKVYFGQNALHDTTGCLTIGDQLNITIVAEPQPPLARGDIT